MFIEDSVSILRSFKKSAKRLGIFFLILCAGLLSLYVFRAPLARSAARIWIVNDQLQRSDAIVVLGGGVENRPFEAARLYDRGLAPKILVMNPVLSPSQELGLTLPEGRIAEQILLKMHVPGSNIVLCSERVDSTRAECNAVRDWATTNAVKSIIITTDLFHARRARWIFEKTLKPAGIRVKMDAAPMLHYNATNWWRHEDGIIAFQNEIIKYLYYRLQY